LENARPDLLALIENERFQTIITILDEITSPFKLESNEYDYFSDITPYCNEMQIKYKIPFYVNASSVLIDESEFIAASIPKPQFIDEFLSLISLTETTLIVNLAGDTFFDYFNRYRIRYSKKTSIYNDEFFLDEKGNSIRRLTFNKWKDHSVPNIDEFLEFYEHFRSILDEQAVTLVHCRAGVGRTGTFLLFHYIFNHYKENGYTHKRVVDGLILLRNSRCHMVQNYKQLSLVVKFFKKKS